MSDTTDSESAAAKTLWFEFLLEPRLLDLHLKSDNASPQPFELITQLLTNALTTSTTSLSSLNPTTNGVNPEETNGVNNGVVGVSGGSGVQAVDNLKKAMDNKKSIAIRYLSFKVMAFLDWDLNQLEANLPPTQQDFLLSELIRYCDLNDSPTGAKLFSCILYYRWILRYIIRSNYPLRAPKGPLIPLTLQQQIDPCFVSNEALDLLMKKLQEQYLIAVSGLDKVIEKVFEKTGNNLDIFMPAFQCFITNADNQFVCDWSRCTKLDTSVVMDDILYDMGRWFYFNEDYVKAKTYFEWISMSRRQSFKHLDGYIVAARDMTSDLTSKVIDIEVIDFDKQANDAIEKLMNGQTFDITVLEGLVDIKEINKIIEKAFKKYVDKRQRNRLLMITKYLSNRIKGLNEELNKSLFTRSDNKTEIVTIDDSDVEMIEEGEIDGDDDHVVKDPELLLLEATDPELIQSLVCKTQKHPLMINSKWVLPLSQSKHLHNLTQTQYDKCHLILAKANQLRSCDLFIESRVLYLSLLEDIQASLPQLADVIRWELLRTDLEYHFHSNDVDERQTNDLITKCVRTLRTIEKTMTTDFPELTELCVQFLLESCSQSLKELQNSPVPVIRFCSAISWLSFDTASNSNAIRAKEFWETVVNMFVNTRDHNSKRGPTSAATLTFTTSLVSFVSKMKDISVITLIISCLAKIHNSIRDNSAQELTIAPIFAAFWPQSLPQALNSSLDSNSVTLTLNRLLDEFLAQKPNELYLLRVKAELCLMDSLFAEAMKYFTLILIIKTKFFTTFSNFYSEEEPIVHKMIQCCVKLCCHTQAALLHQLTREPNYALAFKALSERNCNDSCDDLYEYIWDSTLLEFLINLHQRRGETERKTKAIQLIGQLELNANNSEVVLKEAADVRRGRLLRLFSRTYL